MYPARDQAVAPSSRDTYGGGGNSKPDRCRAHHRVCFSRAAARSLSHTESNIPVKMGSACYRCRSLISIFPSLSLSFSLSLASFPLLLQCHIGHVGGLLRCLLRRALNCLMPFLVIHFCQPIPSGSVCRLFILRHWDPVHDRCRTCPIGSDNPEHRYLTLSLTFKDSRTAKFGHKTSAPATQHCP